MNREYQHEDLIELGAVTAETKGLAIGFVDTERGRQPFAGLTAD